MLFALRYPFLTVLVLALWLAGGGRTLWALDPTRGASQYRFDEWSPGSEGLPYPAVRAIAQGADGYIWVATRNGIGRFDGMYVTAFRHETQSEIPHNGVYSFYVAADGVLWVGTEKGIVWYRDGVWTRPAELQRLAAESIRFITGQQDGVVLIGGRNQLYRYEDGKCQPYVLPPSLKPRSYNKAILLRNGGTLICARPSFSLPQGIPLSTDDGVEDNEAICAAEDREGAVWIGTPRGLHRVKDGVRQTFTVRDGLPVNTVRSLLVDRDGNLWIGTPNGLTRFREGRFEHVVVNGVEKLSHVLCLFEDREGNVWGGTDTGFFRLADAPFTNLSQRDGLQASSVLSLHPARDGSVWIGTWGGGLSHWRDGALKTYRTEDGLLEDGIYSIAEDPQGRVWLSNYTRGISVFDGRAFKHYTAREGAAERVLRVVAGEDGSIWMAEEGIGLSRLVGDRFVRDTSVPLSQIRALYAARDGSIWAAGNEGTARFRNGVWELHRSPAAPADASQVIFEDERGAIWVLRDRGELQRYHDGRVDVVRFHPDSAGPLSYGCAYHAGELWISFRFGVFRVKMSELLAVIAGEKKHPDFVAYDESDGMRSRAPNVAGGATVAVVHNRFLWFATSKGISQIDPQHIRTNPHQPGVVIEELQADKKVQPRGQLHRIAPGRGEVEIKFAGLSFTDPGRVLFRSRLVGLDDHWSEPNKMRKAFYGGLKPGTYRFEVIACNNDAVWASAPAAIDFTILPHFYESWWFVALLVASIVGFVWGVYYWRVRVLAVRAQRLQQQNALLEVGIAARTAELAKSNEALAASKTFYHSLLESLPQVILRKDVHGRIQYANPAFAELMRIPLNEAVGKIDYELCAPHLGAKLKADDQHVLTTGEVMEHEHFVERPGEPKRYLHCKRLPIYDHERKPIGIQVLFWDMTHFRKTEERLKEAQRELLETSRLAGIAEMATGVLHNIGNALNSVNISVSVVADVIRTMKLAGIHRVAQMLGENRENLVQFFTSDPRGRQLPDYFEKLASHLESERALALKELSALEQSVGHIKEIVVAQQSHARVMGVCESVPAPELVEFALRIAETAMMRRGIVVSREFTPTLPVTVMRQKALQILVNLLRNACDSLEESNRPDKRIVVRTSMSAENRVQISITDNGLGISGENLTRIFAFGFTTKPTGHGFGLHSSALAAREMQGSLTAHSAGVGDGATFVLELPATMPANVGQRNAEANA